jgi:hypothetical protein
MNEAEDLVLNFTSTSFEEDHPFIMSKSSNPTPPARGGGLSLYANLLDPDSVTSSATVSKGSVVFKPADSTDEASAKKPQIDPCNFNYDEAMISSCLLTGLDSCPTVSTYQTAPIVSKTKD